MQLNEVKSFDKKTEFESYHIENNSNSIFIMKSGTFN